MFLGVSNVRTLAFLLVWETLRSSCRTSAIVAPGQASRQFWKGARKTYLRATRRCICATSGVGLHRDLHSRAPPPRAGTTEFAQRSFHAALPCLITMTLLLRSRPISSLFAALLLAAIGTTGAHAQSANASRGPARASQACHAVTPQTCTIANSLGRGINLGNMLEAPTEGQWGVTLEPAYIDIVAQSFNTVRLLVRWSNHAAPTADATLDEAFAKKVDQAVD